jgi:hypothetical protein
VAKLIALSMGNYVVGGVRNSLLILVGAVGFLLPIACANPLASSGSANRRLTSGEHPATILSGWTRGAKVSAEVREIATRQPVMGVSEQARVESLDFHAPGLRL